jgi:LmbE family N-acetylglucosaminyl deacetylase
MKPTPSSPPESLSLLAFGAHPDDIEFGCGAIIASETGVGRRAHFVVCSYGEAASNGTPAERKKETLQAAKLLGATVEFLPLDGDAHLEIKTSHALKLAAIIRRLRPSIVLAPSLVENQHPDHYRLGRLVRDAARLARYGGLKELRRAPAFAIDQLYYYSVGSEADPRDLTPVLVDVSSPEIVATWTAAMRAHASQHKTRNYDEMQLTRARLHGLRAGVGYALPLWPNDPIVVSSLSSLGKSARQF